MTKTASQPTSVVKPRILTDAEWSDILRAQRSGLIRFVIFNRTFMHALSATCFGSYFYQLQRSDWRPIPAFHATLDDGLIPMLVFITLFSIVLGTIDWLGKRKTARTAGL